MVSLHLSTEGVFTMCTTSPRADESTAVDRPLFLAVELSTGGMADRVHDGVGGAD